MRFWDSSAIVPLIFQESDTAAVRVLLEQDGDVVVWAMTGVEVSSALWRRVRSGELDESMRATAAESLTELERAWNITTDVVQVAARARRLLALHPLRAADAAQLAAALLVCRERPSSMTFVTLDGRLADAARREGFPVLPAPA